MVKGDQGQIELIVKQRRQQPMGLPLSQGDRDRRMCTR
jgi:hypothetical protein